MMYDFSTFLTLRAPSAAYSGKNIRVVYLKNNLRSRSLIQALDKRFFEKNHNLKIMIFVDNDDDSNKRS